MPYNQYDDKYMIVGDPANKQDNNYCAAAVAIRDYFVKQAHTVGNETLDDLVANLKELPEVVRLLPADLPKNHALVRMYSYAVHSLISTEIRNWIDRSEAKKE